MEKESADIVATSFVSQFKDQVFINRFKLKTFLLFTDNCHICFYTPNYTSFLNSSLIFVCNIYFKLGWWKEIKRTKIFFFDECMHYKVGISNHTLHI